MIFLPVQIAFAAPVAVATTTVPQVPFYSQFKDISSPTWEGRGCGIASLAMLINYYKPGDAVVDTLLQQGIDAGAYSPAGWTYAGLIQLAKQYGFSGEAYDYSTLSSANAFAKFKNSLADGPMMASVHYKFDPKSTIPHLVVIDGIDGAYVYYNDPASTGPDKKITISQFVAGWKKRFLVFRPATTTKLAANT